MRRVGAWLAWWVALAAFWLLLVDTVKPSELALGALAAAAGATAAALVEREHLVAFSPDPRWLFSLWRPLIGLVRDTGTLAVVLWRALARRRRIRGSVRTVTFRAGGDDPRATARRVLAKTAGSLAPNTYVVGIDRDQDLMLVHQLERRHERSSVDPLELG